MKRSVKSFVVAALFASAGMASAKVVHVVPGGAGERNGQDWENAYGDIAAAYAYAAVGADAANPGELRIKAGLYTLEAPIDMKPYVKVVGGYDGETILSGDLGAADTWALNNANKKIAVIQDGAVFLPDYPDDPVSYYSGYDSKDAGEDANHAFQCLSETAEGNVFENLTFVCFLRAAIFAEGGDVEGLLVKGCKFYANNVIARKSSTSNAGAIDIRMGSVAVRDCIFRYNDFGVNFDSSDRVTTNTVSNCQFLNNHAKQQYSTSPQLGGAAGVCIRGNAIGRVCDSTFYRGGATEGNGNGKRFEAGGVSIASDVTGGHSVVSNCVFEGNFTVNTYCVAGALLCTHSSGVVEVSACRFVRNRRNSTGSQSSSACIEIGVDDGKTGSTVLVRDSYFAENVLDNSTAGSNQSTSWGASVLGQRNAGAGAAILVNCTIESNAVFATAFTGKSGPATLATSVSCRLALVNCLVRENDVFGAEGVRLPEFTRDNVYNSTDLSIVNTIIDHSASDYKPFVDDFLGQRGTILATSVIKNFAWGEDVSVYTHANCTDYGFLITPVKPTSEVDPLVAPRLVALGSAFARGVAYNSPVKKWSTPVYLGNDSRAYIKYEPYGAKHWVALTQHQVHLTDAEVETHGLSSESLPIPDALGAPRRVGKSAIGPLNAFGAGMRLIFR